MQDENIINNMPTKDYGFAHPGGKTMTGPIYIDGAEPGDKLEIRILKVTPRAPYGVNNVGNTGGAAPGMLPGITREQGTHIIRYDIAKKIVNFAPDIHFPMRPFVGTMKCGDADGGHRPNRQANMAVTWISRKLSRRDRRFFICRCWSRAGCSWQAIPMPARGDGGGER